MRLYTTLTGDLLGPPKIKKKGKLMDDDWVCDECGARFEFIGYVDEDSVLCVDCEHEKDEEEEADV